MPRGREVEVAPHDGQPRASPIDERRARAFGAARPFLRRACAWTRTWTMCGAGASADRFALSTDCVGPCPSQPPRRTLVSARGLVKTYGDELARAGVDVGAVEHPPRGAPAAVGLHQSARC